MRVHCERRVRCPASSRSQQEANGDTMENVVVPTDLGSLRLRQQRKIAHAHHVKRLAARCTFVKANYGNM